LASYLLPPSPSQKPIYTKEKSGTAAMGGFDFGFGFWYSFFPFVALCLSVCYSFFFFHLGEGLRMPCRLILDTSPSFFLFFSFLSPFFKFDYPLA
jgi:hypothetical protein